MAYALGLIGPAARIDLLQIAGIRNKFAHEFEGQEWTFEHSVIQAKLDAMTFVKWIAPVPSGASAPPPNNRGKFVGAIYWYSAQLHGELIANPQILFTAKFLTL
jgi:hypothetical protein